LCAGISLVNGCPAFVATPSQWGDGAGKVNTEDTIHKIVRFHQGVTPPRLMVQRVSEDSLNISYNSLRKMCSLLKGIVKGAGAYYKEPVTILESRCTLKGDSECLVTVRVAAQTARGIAFPKAAGA
jgi:hypothetical protein